MPALRLVVLGDSLAFTDDVGPQLPTAPHIFPNVVARALGGALGRDVETNIVGRAGWTSRDAWHTLTKDRHLMFEVLARADAVIVSFGSFDHGPMGVPAAVAAVVPYLRPERVRRSARRAVRWAYPRLVSATGARFPITPRAEFTRLYDGVLLQVRSLARGAAGVVLGPAEHRSAYYAWRNPHVASGERAQFEAAARHGFAAVACWPLVEPHQGRLNSDGIHWPADVHAAVGQALTAPLLDQLRGAAPGPPSPPLPGSSPNLAHP